MNKEDKRILLDIKEGNENSAAKKLLKISKSPIFSVCQDFNLIDDREDVWQDSVLLFIDKTKKGTVLSCRITSFIYGIAVKKCLSIINKKKRATRHLEIIREDFKNNKTFNYNEGYLALLVEPDPRLKVVNKLIETMAPKCKEILNLYYKEGISMGGIEHLMGYKNRDTTKTKKSRCITILKEKIKDYYDGRES